MVQKCVRPKKIFNRKHMYTPVTVLLVGNTLQSVNWNALCHAAPVGTIGLHGHAAMIPVMTLLEILVFYPHQDRV